MKMDIEKRKALIEAEMAAMQMELTGCDWCCGGGDERYQLLQDELEILENDRQMK